MRLAILIFSMVLITACGDDDKKSGESAGQPADPAANSQSVEAVDTSFYVPVPDMAHPADNASSPGKVELGRILYFDPRLSGDNSISCATCHDPQKGWGDGKPRAIGFGGKELGRHSPTVINSGFFTTQFWDGRAPSLEEQAKGPIQAAGEMNQNAEELVKELSAISEYMDLFGKVFGESGITLDNIAKAIAAFERTVVSKNSAYDKYVAGDKEAMSASAINGMDMFFGKAKCAVCHNGPALTDSGFHNIGVKPHDLMEEDLGRFNVSKDEADKGAFKTPGLRSISQSAPYMHNGSEATLKDVVEFYNRGGDVEQNRSSIITPLELTSREVLDLVEFLRALEGEPIPGDMPALPGMTDASEK